MTIQSIFNMQALEMMPKSHAFARFNRMGNARLLRMINDSYKPISEMNTEELLQFDIEICARLEHVLCENI